MNTSKDTGPRERVSPSGSHPALQKNVFLKSPENCRSQLLRNLTSFEYAQSIRKRIVDNTTFDLDYYGAVLYQPDDYGTAHVAVVAPNGDAVSVTSSINQ